jgi:hypothetical protein
MNITKLKIPKWSKLFSSEDSRFILVTALKLAGVYLGAMILTAYLMWLVLSLNNIFFEAHGYPELKELRSAYFDYILSNTFENLSYILLFYIILFFAGIYTGRILIRPFDQLAKYCEEAIENKNTTYNPDLFSDFKLLTRFSDFFFQYIYEARLNKKLVPNTIPPSFSKIHQPTFDRVFFFHFFLLISILAIITTTYVSAMIYEMYEQMVNLAIKTIPKNSKQVAYFLKNQEFVFDSVSHFATIAIIISYVALAFHLYTKVSGAVFAFFATMRSFMKGNHSARVHLLEYRHLRPQGRAINKFLDHICREADSNENKDSNKKNN